MITEDYVSFETAKLLKEKGFNGDFTKAYSTNGTLISNFTENCIIAPTHQMAMKWLKEYHCLYIDIELLSGPSFSWYIWFMNDPQHIMGCSEDYMNYYDSYEEACEAAVKYCLENLI